MLRRGCSLSNADRKMGMSWVTALLLVTSWTIVTSMYDEKICYVVNESFGPVTPLIPSNFELRREVIDYNRKEEYYQEIYFDHTNSREKYVLLAKGVEHHLLFDYETQQIIFYDRLHPYSDIKRDPLSHVCTAIDMDDFVYKQEFGFETTGLRVKMRSAGEELGFGGKYKYRYVGNFESDKRGVLIDMFTGCIYQDNIDATMNITYSFTSKRGVGVGPAAGTMEEQITGINNGFLSVPVKADIFGSLLDENTKNITEFKRTYNYYWFDGVPKFKSDTFKIPPYLYCSNYQGRKEMKKFPTAFSTRLQKTKLSNDILGKATTTEVTSFENVVYYQEKKLARRDFTPGPSDTDIKSAFETMSPVKTIYDFFEGLMYVTNIASGRCYVRPIVHADFMEAGNETNMYISIGTPEHIFQMETDTMEYKGKDFTRDIECDVWAGEYKDERYNITYVKETYISTNGWHEIVDDKEEFGVPIKHSFIQKQMDGQLTEEVTSYSFLKFKAKPPLLREFDVSNCIDTQNHKDFAIFLTISATTKEAIFKYKHRFLDTVQYYINDAAQLLSPLRVQRLQLRTLSQVKGQPAILFTLVDKLKLKTKIPIGQIGASLEEAVINLQNYVDRNQFAIKFYPPGSKEYLLVPGFKGSLYVRKSNGNLTYFAPVQEVTSVHSKKEAVTTEDEEYQPKVMYDDASDLNDINSEGMTPGALALLSLAMLFIGIGIGVCIMYLYQRFKGEAGMDDKVPLSSRSVQNASKDISLTQSV